jgi:cell division protein FtsB
MRYLAIALGILVLLLQFPLWLGKGGWLRVWDLDRQVGQQKEQNDKLKRRNGALDAEVRDLKQGFEAAEERARSELGMVRSDEIFFQVIPAPDAAARIMQPGTPPAAQPPAPTNAPAATQPPVAVVTPRQQPGVTPPARLAPNEKASRPVP